MTLNERISTRTALVTVVGQGYVGLPLALTVAQSGYTTYGLDVDVGRVADLLQGRSYISDISDDELRRALESGRYHPTDRQEVISRSDVVIICVPTPLRKSKDPDISYIITACDYLEEHLHEDSLVILESTTYPGTTDELIAARLERRGLVTGRNVFVCFSPERVDPGNQVFNTANTPKVIGGVTAECTRLGCLFYNNVMERVVPVNSARTAEMVKLLENTFRAVNIGLVNELAIMCERMGIDIWEVIDAAATKPFGFMPFYPGPGIGGHCIPLDPMYLAWKAKSYDFYGRFIEVASDINGNMPRHVVRRIAEALNMYRKPLNGSRVLILGVAYKRDVSDTRESPSIEILRLLKSHGAIVDFADPLVPCINEPEGVLSGINPTDTVLSNYDCVVLATDHSCFDYGEIARNAQLILDTRNAFRGSKSPNIVRLGAPIFERVGSNFATLHKTKHNASKRARNRIATQADD